MRKKIAIVAGGNSSEYVISIKSAAMIEKIIDRALYEPYKVFVKGTRWFYCDAEGREFEVDKNDFSLNIDGEKITLEYALILIHGTPGEDGLLQAYFKLMGIPYSSCNSTVSAITFDKSLCKRALCQTSIKVAQEILVSKGDKVDPSQLVKKLGLPMFVKPNASGSSFGITKVKLAEELLPAIENAFKESEQVLVEEFIGGTEVSCGIMMTKDKNYIFAPTEIVSKKEFFDYEAKYTDGMSDEITPARISQETTDALAKNSQTIYRTLNCRGIVRIDYIIKEGVPYMIEINTVPGMSENSIIPKQARYAGITLTELFNEVIAETI